MSVEIKNTKITFSTMKNRLKKGMLTRSFTVELPTDSEEITSLQEQFKTLEKKAVEAFTQEQGKKVKGASREKGCGAFLFTESEYNPNHTRLNFTVYSIEEEKDGSFTEKLYPMYKSPKFCYKIDNNGQKSYNIAGRETLWAPCHDDTVNIVASLVATYNKKDNRVVIRLKANEVELIETSYKGRSGGYSITLDEDVEDEAIEDRVENKSAPAKDFSEDELAELDI